MHFFRLDMCLCYDNYFGASYTWIDYLAISLLTANRVKQWRWCILLLQMHWKRWTSINNTIQLIFWTSFVWGIENWKNQRHWGKANRQDVFRYTLSMKNACILVLVRYRGCPVHRVRLYIKLFRIIALLKKYCSGRTQSNGIFYTK